MTPIESWEEEFFDRFGANKIWVTPSRDNVETIFDIHSFIRTKLDEAEKSAMLRQRNYDQKLVDEAYRKGREDACDYILRHWNDISEKTLDETRSNLFEEARHAGEEKDTRKSICNDCFDGDHIQCSQGPCECVCRAGEVSKEVDNKPDLFWGDAVQ